MNIREHVESALLGPRITDGRYVRELESTMDGLAMTSHAAGVILPRVITKGRVKVFQFQEFGVTVIREASPEQESMIRVLRNSGRDEDGRVVELGVNGRVSEVSAFACLRVMAQESYARLAEIAPWRQSSLPPIRHADPR